MPSTRGLDDFPDSVVDEWPRAIRDAYARRAKVGAAVRLYRRRGWNASAVSYQLERENLALKRLLDDYVFASANPTLF